MDADARRDTRTCPPRANGERRCTIGPSGNRPFALSVLADMSHSGTGSGLDARLRCRLAGLGAQMIRSRARAKPRCTLHASASSSLCDTSEPRAARLNEPARHARHRALPRPRSCSGVYICPTNTAPSAAHPITTAAGIPLLAALRRSTASSPHHVADAKRAQWPPPKSCAPARARLRYREPATNGPRRPRRRWLGAAATRSQRPSQARLLPAGPAQDRFSVVLGAGLVGSVGQVV